MARKSKAPPATVAATQSSAAQSPATQSSAATWRAGVCLPAMASGLALWAAAAPLNWSFLAWLAPLGWLWVADRQLPVGRRGYFTLWLSGCLFWLLSLQGIRLAYWPLYFGWLALSLYLAIYIPLFVGLTRVARQRLRLPLVMAAPLVWTGLELVRSYLLTGFAANSLAHTQAHYPRVIQVVDQVGGGGLSWIMMSVAVAGLQLARGWPQRVQPAAASQPVVGIDWLGVAWAAALLAITLGYGNWRLAQADRMLASQQPLLRVLLLQENTPTIFEYNPQRSQRAWTSYLNLTRAAGKQHAPVDLVVWPESTFTANEPWLEADLSSGVPEELQREQVDKSRLLQAAEELQANFRYKAELVLEAARGLDAGESRIADSTAAASQPHLLVGSDAALYYSDRVERYNAAMFIGPQGDLVDRYYKLHRVMFGEYIPLGILLKWLGDAFGLPGINAGTQFKCFHLEQVCVAPSICFESTLPHLIARQVRELKAAGTPPDVLINITNDSWFRGSSILDHHLACSMLCAVENRRPMLVAANTGLSAEIDGSGRLLQYAERLQAKALLATPKADGRWGLVQALGYPVAWLAGIGTLLIACVGIITRRPISPNLPRNRPT